MTKAVDRGRARVASIKALVSNYQMVKLTRVEQIALGDRTFVRRKSFGSVTWVELTAAGGHMNEGYLRQEEAAVLEEVYKAECESIQPGGIPRINKAGQGQGSSYNQRRKEHAPA